MSQYTSTFFFYFIASTYSLGDVIHRRPIGLPFLLLLPSLDTRKRTGTELFDVSVTGTDVRGDVAVITGKLRSASGR